MYDFDAKLKEGQRHEATLDAYFRGRGADVKPATRDEQRRGIDRWIDGKAVEYKADSAASRTRNCFVETVSVDTTGKRGWAYTSEATWLFYFLPGEELLYIIRMADLRDRLPVWERRFRTVPVKNDGYYTHGLIVPQRFMEQIADQVLNGVPDGR